MTLTSLTEFDRARMMQEDVSAGMSLVMHVHGNSNEPVSLASMQDGETLVPDILHSTDLYELTRNYITYLAGGGAEIERNGYTLHVQDDKAIVQLTIATMKIAEEEIERAKTIHEAREATNNRLGQLHRDLDDDDRGLERFSEETGLPRYIGNPIEMAQEYSRVRDDIDAAQISVRIMQQIASNYFSQAASYEPPENRASQNPKIQKILALKV